MFIDIENISSVQLDRKFLYSIYCVKIQNSTGKWFPLRGCIQKFQDWPPGARTANGAAICHRVQLYRYFVSDSSEFCRQLFLNECLLLLFISLSAHIGCTYLTKESSLLSNGYHLVPRSEDEWSYTSTPPIRLHGVVLS